MAVTGTLEAAKTGAQRPTAAAREADLVVTELYAREYRKLVRLAVLLLGDVQSAEEAVQDAFIAMHSGWESVRDADKAFPYLRRAVVNKARSVLRHRLVTAKYAPAPPPDEPSAEQRVLESLERSAVVVALRGLPVRQREAIVLRYYAGLSEAEIAAAMGVSKGSVKSHTARGMSTLRATLAPEVCVCPA